MSQYVHFVPHPRSRRWFQVQVEAATALGRTKAVKDPLERDAHATDRCASLVAVMLDRRRVGMRRRLVARVVTVACIVAVGQSAQHGRCGHGNVERYALAGGQIAKPCGEGGGRGGGSNRAGGIRDRLRRPPDRTRCGRRRAEGRQCCRASEPALFSSLWSRSLWAAGAYARSAKQGERAHGSLLDVRAHARTRHHRQQ